MTNEVIGATRGRRGRGGSPVSPTEAKKRAQSHLGGQTQEAGKIEKQGETAAKPEPVQQQAKAPATAAKAAPKKAAPKKGAAKGQQQDAGDTSRQGDGGSVGSKTEDNTNGQIQALGSVREVGGHKIEVMAVPAQGGGKMKPEVYPFSKLGFCTVVQGPDGEVIAGDSIFIPASDGPQKHLTAARKAVRGTGIRYMMRQMTHNGKPDGTPGMRFWKRKEGDKLTA